MIDVVKNKLLTLAFQFEENNEESEFSKKLEEYIPTESTIVSELPEKLFTFFVSLGEENAIVKIMRVINQSVLAPVLSQLKSGLGTELPFNSVRGSWKINVNFTKSGILIVHEKTEQGAPGQGDWTFTWSCSFLLDKEAKLLSTFVNMINIDVDKLENKKERKEVKTKIEMLFYKKFEFQIQTINRPTSPTPNQKETKRKISKIGMEIEEKQKKYNITPIDTQTIEKECFSIHQKPLEELSCHIDLPRLAHNLIVSEHTQSKELQSSGNSILIIKLLFIQFIYTWNR